MHYRPDHLASLHTQRNTPSGFTAFGTRGKGQVFPFGREVLQGPPGGTWMPDFPWGAQLIFVQNRAAPRLVPRHPCHTKEETLPDPKVWFRWVSVCGTGGFYWGAGGRNGCCWHREGSREVRSGTNSRARTGARKYGKGSLEHARRLGVSLCRGEVNSACRDEVKGAGI
ncbi:hypothetical protein E2C01_032185 [Portunus trituberculatus]|uniref:Uncharacterized protein n=1 Tax=Portunus trituberculatus TaxID=210409 RepID=A0A5B7F252_PORTR|nr:hypothetical protein [Portunus trituberculatus]